MFVLQKVFSDQSRTHQLFGAQDTARETPRMAAAPSVAEFVRLAQSVGHFSNLCPCRCILSRQALELVIKRVATHGLSRDEAPLVARRAARAAQTVMDEADARDECSATGFYFLDVANRAMSMMGLASFSDAVLAMIDRKLWGDHHDVGALTTAGKKHAREASKPTKAPGYESKALECSAHVAILEDGGSTIAALAYREA